MKILAFESSAKAAGAALLEDGILRAEAFQNSGMTHSCTLMKMAEDLLASSGVSPQEIDAAAVAAGPGSFTGVRIGVAAAKGFAWGREIPCYGVSTLYAMALGAASADGVYCCCMDARRAQVYNAIFACKDGALTRMTEDRAISLVELQQDLLKIDKKIFLVGDGAALCYTTLSDRVPQLCLMPEQLRQQRASGAALAAWEQIQSGEGGDAAALTPNYIRLSQAERERQSRMNEA